MPFISGTPPPTKNPAGQKKSRLWGRVVDPLIPKFFPCGLSSFSSKHGHMRGKHALVLSPIIRSSRDVHTSFPRMVAILDIEDIFLEIDPRLMKYALNTFELFA